MNLLRQFRNLAALRRNFLRFLVIAVLVIPAGLLGQYSNYASYPVYNGRDLGLHHGPQGWQLRVWAPTASAVELRLYNQANGGEPRQQLLLQPAEQGTWKIDLPEKWKGYYYTLRAQINNQWQQEVVDPYARAVGVNGTRAALINAADITPKGWHNDRPPQSIDPNQAIIYEAHIRDLGMNSNSGMQHKGKYLELTESNTRSPEGQATGIAHLKEMGITHLHLLPVFDFYTVNESHPEIPQYNWGYDPLNYNVPEGSYATDAADPACRIREFREMIMALHQNGIRVIMDVVYNHTHQAETSAFNQLVPGYYYRQNAGGGFSNATACGNETASERPMMRKFMLESLRYWVQAYHIDGFRFDLMGVHDIATMNLISDELHKLRPDILLYGEGWTAGASPLPDSLRALKANAARLRQIAVFSDDIRDAIKGSVFEATDPGFISGKKGMEASIQFGVAASCPHQQLAFEKLIYAKTPYAAGPWNTVTYCSCHDNHTLWDKLQLSSPASSPHQHVKQQMLGLSIVLTAQGIPFLQAGSEFMRSKKGNENSYNAGDSINAIDWSLKSTYRESVSYIEALIAMRKQHPAFRFHSADQVKQHIHFLEKLPEQLVAYQLDGDAVGDSWKKVLVIYNGQTAPQAVSLPPGNWKVYISNSQLAQQPQSASGTWQAEAISCSILYQ